MPAAERAPTMASVPALSRDPDYCWKLVDLVIENQQFSIPDFRLRESSDTFAVLYLDRPGIATQSPTGYTIVEDVTVSEFRSFLKVVYPRSNPDTRLVLTREEWISVLKLSSKWRFNEYRRIALNELSKHHFKPADRILLAREYFVEAWLLQGLDELVAREDPISREEAEQFGPTMTRDLCGIREQILRYAAMRGKSSKARAKLIEEVFVDMLTFVRGHEAQFQIELKTQKSLMAGSGGGFPQKEEVVTRFQKGLRGHDDAVGVEAQKKAEARAKALQREEEKRAKKQREEDKANEKHRQKLARQWEKEQQRRDQEARVKQQANEKRMRKLAREWEKEHARARKQRQEAEPEEQCRQM